ncbi:MAG: VOC family protein [Rhizomicrobium sp.]
MISLNQLDLVCRDVDKSIAFYRLLGVKIPASAAWRTKTGAHHVRIGFDDTVELALDSQKLARAYNASYRGGSRGNVVIGFEVGTRRAVDALYRKMTAAGHRGLQPPWDAFWGSRYAIVEDPDGNAVGLMSPVDPKNRSAGPEL